MAVVKPTETSQKVSQLIDQFLTEKEGDFPARNQMKRFAKMLLPDPSNPLTLLLPLYRVEVPRWRTRPSPLQAKKVGWGGPWSSYRPESAGQQPQEVGRVIGALGSRIRIPPPEGGNFSPHNRFMFTQQVADELLSMVKRIATEHPTELRVLEAPEVLKKFAVYEDPDQVLINLRKMLKKTKIIAGGD